MLLKKKIFLLAIVLLLLTPVISYAQVCETAKVKEVLKKTLHLYFTQKNISVTKDQIKDLLTFYLSINSQNLTADCSARGSLTNQQIINIVNLAESLPDKVPSCADGTKYGECSTNKPSYCFAGKLYNKCQMCGCPSNSRCDSNGVCLRISQNITCFNNLDCGKSEFIGNYYCFDNYITKNYVNYTCINPGTASSKCVSSNGTIYLDYCDTNLNQACITGESACQNTVTNVTINPINQSINQSINQTTIGQCNDTIDNDGDLKVDYPNDMGCTTPNGSSEQLYSGACVIHSNLKPLASIYAQYPDIGSGYSKQSIPGIYNISILKTKCDENIRQNLLSSYCLTNSENAYYSAETYFDDGSHYQSSSGAGGSSAWNCASLNNSTLISGACYIGRKWVNYPPWSSTTMSFYDIDIGQSWVKKNVPGVNNITLLRNYCTKDMYLNMLKTYCSSEIAKSPLNGAYEPVQFGVVAFGPGGGYSGTGSAQFNGSYDNSDYDCSQLSLLNQTNLSAPTGVCLIQDYLTSFEYPFRPSFYDPDFGNGYAKLAKPGINNLTLLAAACTDADFTTLFKAFCTTNSNPALRRVVTYNPSGGMLGVGGSGVYYYCQSITNGTQPTGVCMIRDHYTSTPMFYAQDIGNGYAKLAKPGINNISLLKTSCTSSDYLSLLQQYCNSNSNPVSQSVVTYGSGGGDTASSCGAFGCSDVSCASLANTSQPTGVCMIRDSSTSVPSYYAPDNGKGYAKLAKPGVNTLSQLSTSCTSVDYNNLLQQYCKTNINPVQRTIVTYGTGGGWSGLTCSSLGCTQVSCP